MILGSSHFLVCLRRKKWLSITGSRCIVPSVQEKTELQCTGTGNKQGSFDPFSLSWCDSAAWIEPTTFSFRGEHATMTNLKSKFGLGELQVFGFHYLWSRKHYTVVHAWHGPNWSCYFHISNYPLTKQTNKTKRLKLNYI